MATIGVVIALNINTTNGSRNVNGNGITKSDGVIKSGDASPSTSMWGLLPTFSPIVELLQ